jgi:type VI secretion system protein ImpA
MLESGDLDQGVAVDPSGRAEQGDDAPLAPSPPAEAESCGADLDAEGDADYLNFFAQVEGILPTSFFSAEDGKPFDPTTVDIEAQRAVVATLQARTRDIRLAAVDARLAVLNRDIPAFTAGVVTIAEWLERFWDDVHPRLQGGDTDARQRAVGSLDLPTVVFPLQYSPLFEARRSGTVTYRRWLVASGEAKPREGDAEMSAAVMMHAFDETDAAVLAAARGHMARLDDALGRIRRAFAAHGRSAELPTLSALVKKMRAFVGRGAPDSDAQSGENQDGAATGGQGGAAREAGPVPASLADATLALSAIADYYSRREPSSPVLPLVRQARELVGKSFHEIMTILVPSQVEKAAFQIGTDEVFALPLGRLSDLSAVAPSAFTTDGSDQAGDPMNPEEPARPRYRVETRAQAIALLDDVQRYFRISEPSSPVPMLCERGRAMAERDFMSLLRDVLPKAALRNVNADD